MFDTPIVFLQYFTEKVNCEKKIADDTEHAELPSIQRDNYNQYFQGGVSEQVLPWRWLPVRAVYLQARDGSHTRR